MAGPASLNKQSHGASNRSQSDVVVGRDKRLLKLIRAFLNPGVMENGLVSLSVEATPREVQSLPLHRR